MRLLAAIHVVSGPRPRTEIRAVPIAAPPPWQLATHGAVDALRTLRSRLGVRSRPTQRDPSRTPASAPVRARHDT
jgi:hypothetical protein